MNKTTLQIFKKIKKKYKNIKLRTIVDCVCNDISSISKTEVKMQELFERTERGWPGNIFKDIERRCILRIKRDFNKTDIIKNFFEPFMKCPEQIQNCQKLREEYDARLEIIKKDNKCSGCSLASFKAHFINTVLEKHIKT